QFCIFVFQAEDGIRDFHVTGVQTCALPIFSPISIALALGMAYNGAAGETETAMAKALQLEGLLQEGLLQEALLQEGPRQEGLLQDSTTTASPDADGTRLTRTDINASNLALLEALTGTGTRLDIATSIRY